MFWNELNDVLWKRGLLQKSVQCIPHHSLSSELVQSETDSSTFDSSYIFLALFVFDFFCITCLKIIFPLQQWLTREALLNCRKWKANVIASVSAEAEIISFAPHISLTLCEKLAVICCWGHPCMRYTTSCLTFSYFCSISFFQLPLFCVLCTTKPPLTPSSSNTTFPSSGAWIIWCSKEASF